MTVPKGKEIWIGNRRYKEGDTLPETYVKSSGIEKKQQPKQEPAKEADKK